jgi:hypothetical protein
MCYNFLLLFPSGFKELLGLPLSRKESISRVVRSQTFQTLTEFIEKIIKIYDIKLVSLDVPYNIFS